MCILTQIWKEDYFGDTVLDICVYLYVQFGVCVCFFFFFLLSIGLRTDKQTSYPHTKLT